MATDKRHKILNAPNLRFPEFEGEWELHRTTEYFEFKNGLNPEAKRFGDGIKFISVMDILNNRYITYDKIIGCVVPNTDDLEDFGVNYGDVLFQRSSETLEDVGRANVYLDKKTALFGGFVIRGKKCGDYNPLFFRYLLSSPNVRKRIIIQGAGAQHFNIGQEGLSKVYLNVPSKDEQKRVSQLFDLIDERIETQIGAISKQESLIKAMAGKLTCEGKKVRLADLVDCHSSTMQENDITNDGYYPVYGATGICGYTNSPLCNEDAIIIVKDGSGVGNIKYACSGFSILGTLCYLTAKQNVSIGFVYCCLINFDFSPYKTGMAIPHIYFKDYGKGKINIKSAAEQQKTKTLLFLLMEKLDVERKLLAQYKLQKQYLLSQMFV